MTGYLFGRGDGQDTVIDGDFTVGNTDTLRFKEGLTLGDVRHHAMEPSSPFYPRHGRSSDAQTVF